MMRKVIIVTGGGRGIGAATCLLAAKKGFAVVVNYRNNKPAAEEVVAKIVASGGEAIAVQADVSREKEVTRLFEITDQSFGRVFALVNNAGILEPKSRVTDMSQERLLRIFSVNSIGPFLCAREAVKRMSTRFGGSGGAIVNVTSTAIRQGGPGEYVDYAASKAALEVFTIGLAKEVAAEGIRVNAVRPGVAYTEIHASGGDADRVDRVKNTIPMQRGGQPEEIARAIMWLISEEASYSAGAILDVSGGR